MVTPAAVTPAAWAQQCFDCYGFSPPGDTACNVCGSTNIKPVTDEEEEIYESV